MKRRKILLVYPSWSTFVKSDFEILSSEFDVATYHFKPAKGGIKVGIELLKQAIFLTINIFRFSIVYIWFADQHSLLPILFAKLTGRKSFLVIGGYDVCRVPSLQYGVFVSRLRGFAASWSMKHCTLNLAVSKNVARKVKAIQPDAPLEIVYNCVTLRPEKVEPWMNRTKVLTVARIDSERTFLIKGIDTFVETARLLPDVPFVIAGFDKQRLLHLSSGFPKNITLLDSLPHDDLPDWYRKTRVYCQLSRSESFGIALAESILYGCIPIVTREGGMPEVVENNGFIVRRDPHEIAEIINNIMQNKIPNVINPETFINKFGKEVRSKILIKILLNEPA